MEHVSRFMTYPEKNEGRHPITRDTHRRYLTDYALPYFVNAKNCVALRQFPAHARGLADWHKQEAGASPKQIKRVNQSLGIYGSSLSSRKMRWIVSLLGFCFEQSQQVRSWSAVIYPVSEVFSPRTHRVSARLLSSNKSTVFV